MKDEPRRKTPSQQRAALAEKLEQLKEEGLRLGSEVLVKTRKCIVEDISESTLKILVKGPNPQGKMYTNWVSVSQINQILTC